MAHRKADQWTISEVVPQVAEIDVIDLALRLTLLTLLLRPVGDWLLRPVILGLAASGVLLPGLLRKPWLWGALTVLTGLRVVLDWQLADNHAYLLCYWCFAITLALLTPDPRACLALNGRLLIGWAFAFATLWKLLSPDYLDGRFFRVMLLTDPRFAGFAQLAGGVTPDLLAALREFVHQHADGPLVEPLPAPLEPGRFLWLARGVTLWTVGIEGATAVAFLWPAGRGLSRRRDVCLLMFCVTTYAVATVAGFGWLLGGPEIRNRKVLAISTSMRNVGICLPIAANYFPGTDALVPILAFSGISIPMNMLFALITGRTLRDTEASARPVEA